MSSSVAISPITRIEGHLGIHARLEPAEGGNGKLSIAEARCEGEMFRGLERILEGRDPLDAQQITQRICGVCPISHATASIRAQEMAYGIRPPTNGRLVQNLILAANYLQSHILHFYHLAALDFVDVKAVLSYTGSDKLLLSLRKWIEQAIASGDTLPATPFLPRMEARYVANHDDNMALVLHYVQALDMRRICHEMAAVFGAKAPHSTAMVPGGCTQGPTLERVLSYRSRLKHVMGFVRDVYIPDLLRVAKEFPEYFDIGRGCGNFLCFGNFPMGAGDERFVRPGVLIDGQWEQLDPERIREDSGHSWFSGPSGLHPSQGQTNPQPKKADAYSWIKAPRYRDCVVEVGALARVMTNYHDPAETWIRREVNSFLAATDLPAEKLVSVLGRHVARGLESLWIAQQAFRWLDELELDRPAACDFAIPSQGAGYGLMEAPRGALGHWISIDKHVIRSYQCVVPTTWNCSPRDDRGRAGPVEQALEGTVVEDALQVVEIGRIVRSFDPCLACAVH
jgi:ferredoxin hydrogenase large subunit/hydrogenase large subunit